MRKKRSLKTPKLRAAKVQRAKLLKRHSQHFVYIVECATGTFYTGYTKDIENRLKLHNSGRGAKYLRGKLPVKLVYHKEFKYYKLALNAERAIKRYSRKRKERLVTESALIS